MAPARLIPVYILAGGRSSRFGSDKALALVEGVPLIVRQADALRAAGYNVTVVADVAGKYDGLGLTTLGDVRPGAGPLGGLLTALEHCHAAGAPRLLLSSCDLLTVQEAWLSRLIEAAAGAPAAAYRGDRWHPLPGVYATSLLVRARDHLGRGELSLWRLLEAAGAAAVSFPPGWSQPPQANTPEDLRRYIEGH